MKQMSKTNKWHQTAELVHFVVDVWDKAWHICHWRSKMRARTVFCKLTSHASFFRGFPTLFSTVVISKVYICTLSILQDLFTWLQIKIIFYFFTNLYIRHNKDFCPARVFSHLQNSQRNYSHCGMISSNRLFYF